MDQTSHPPVPTASLCVLASGSSGNCSVLAIWTCGRRRLCLIDAGLSPRRTEERLRELGLSIGDIDCILLTHLDHDHWHGGWNRRLPASVPVRVHARHAGRARRGGINVRLAPFDGEFELYAGVCVRGALGLHDDLGVVSYRVEFACCGSGFGFATDVGRITEALLEHLRGVDVLAIESNYCPRMQATSRRPWFLKRRIMGGQGHLSNEEALRAIEAIGPRTHVVLLHLSEECNCPKLVAEMHAGADYALTISAQDRPTRWVPIAPPPGASVQVRTMVQFPLFGVAPPGGSAGAPAPVGSPA
jgi:phosphoribosyl 1,2-cyclic phosphodiesterase